MATALPDYGRLAAALEKDREGVLARWLDAFARSPMRLPRTLDRGAMAQQASPILEGLSEALSPGRSDAPEPPRLIAGSAQAREIEKSVAFAAATMGAAGSSGFDVAALIFSLREVLLPSCEGAARDELLWFLEWLAVLAADSLATARESAAFERVREELDEGTPVILVTPELPASLFVGRPDAGVIGSIFSRLLLQSVRVGARAAILDVSGLAERTAGSFLDSLERFLGHRKLSGSLLAIGVGVLDEDRDLWRAAAQRTGCGLELCEHFDAAVATGLAASGQRLVSG